MDIVRLNLQNVDILFREVLIKLPEVDELLFVGVLPLGEPNVIPKSSMSSCMALIQFPVASRRLVNPVRIRLQLLYGSLNACL